MCVRAPAYPGSHILDVVHGVWDGGVPQLAFAEVEGEGSDQDHAGFGLQSFQVAMMGGVPTGFEVGLFFSLGLPALTHL